MGTTRIAGVVVGMWKFNDSVGSGALARVANGYKQANPGSYGQMLIRRCSKDQLAISFSYKLGDQNFKHFSDRLWADLKQKFGDKFVGHDLTTDVWTIDDQPIA
jgi:hypothetical protein